MTDRPDVSVLDEVDDDLPVRALMQAFADPVARYTVYYLLERQTVSVDRLAEVVVGWLNADTGSVATRSDRDRTRTMLYHVHLPVLDSLGVVEFDSDDRTVATAEASPSMESFVDWVRRLDRADGGADSS